jgi:hypothetical protein
VRITDKISKELVLEFILFCGGILSISLFFRNNVTTLSLLLIAWIIGLKFWHKKQDVYFFVVGAIIGPLAEIICIDFGVWAYANPTFFGIPVWLPFAWGLVTLLIKRIVETLVKMEIVG